MTGKSEKLQYREKFILRSMGAYGYLKFPRAFVEKFNHDKDRLEEPEAYLDEDPATGEIRLSFVWSRDDIENARRE